MTLIRKLALELEKSEDEVANFLLNAPKRYKVYTIPKRTSGHRVIAQPSKELKEYQRKYLGFQKLPIHDSALAYRKGISIKQNALAHKNNPYLLKLDLENFFNSISDKLFWKVWASLLPLPSSQDRQTLKNLLFWCPSKKTGGPLVLSIGAPSSPLISNFFMYKFDSIMSKFCSEREIVYTRYADDLTFSTKHKGSLFQLPEVVKEMLSELFGGAIRINRKKTRFSSKAHNRHVTGITINNNGDISIGRKQKRYIKYLVHQVELNRAGREDIEHLRGLIAFASHIEPMFIQSLKKKYTTEIISKIIEGQNG
ncbi:Reverse transcriptase (RNA-dependent DNA polymerase) [Marinomonas gallaica]|uniref:RNA-directed DNA polymerase n=1 Tax=Marinomonas gallaica TaxID=1806667 RepID=A0A1C3JRV9_9GAMM|nr:retron St85 family RNA-directed DNA polymerase [Marinomonas gallaica]SBT17855.1 Reverse transcriptase (RNA-dependent DNA polymerase) [Marinomonas gallaica]SBT22059.1 Reverse transcriptase (RNA-dependent DNA polymerase) [Marinomonas gallaica]